MREPGFSIPSRVNRANSKKDLVTGRIQGFRALQPPSTRLADAFTELALVI
jgi:hypothetical protein